MKCVPKPPDVCPSHRAGEDAVKFEGLPDDVITAKAVAVLRSIFGDQNVPEVQFSMQFSIQFSIVDLHIVLYITILCVSSV